MRTRVRSPTLRLTLCTTLLLLLCVTVHPQARHKRHAVGSDHTNAEKWLDEGFETSATLSDWEAQETFCFYENATLRIRLDPLNSTLQPYVVRAFGQSKEAHEIYDFLVDKMSKLQEFAWPFRSFFWAWSDLRVVVKSPHHEELNFKFTRSAGMLCRGMMLADQSAPMLIEYIPDYAVEYLQIALRFLSTHLCETCVHGCARECTPLGNDACMVVLSPYHAPCVTVSAPSKPFLSSSAPTLPFSLAFQTVLSSLFIQNFSLGLFLFYSSERLSRSRTFHYFLGASIGICFSAMLALYFFTRQTRAAAKMVPGAQFIQSIGSLVSFAVPFTSFVLMPSIYKLVSWGLSYLTYIWSCEELLGIPHLGKIYFFFFGFLGFVLVWWNQWGASPKSETKQDQDEIDELGYLDEDLPLTTSQIALSRFLKLVGVALLFYSTSSTEISLVLVLLVSLTRLFQFLGTAFYFWYHFERAGRHSVLISKKEFEKQAVSETEKALKQLQDFLQKNPDELDKVSEENEIRLRRFMKGRNHMDVATRDSALSARQRAQKSFWSSCSIQ